MATEINLVKDSTVLDGNAQLKLIANYLKSISESQKAIASSTVVDAMDWYGIARIVYGGNAAATFPIGTSLDTIKGETTYKWDVVHHGTVKGRPAMFLCMHNVLRQMQFDNTEALYYAQNGLTAGNYHFTLLSDYDTAYGGGQTYWFTLTKPVPEGGVLMFPWGYQTQASATKISSYSSVTGTEEIETVSVAAGTNGTNLGVADGTNPLMNHIHRIRYGSSNWKESAIRQYLNSATGAGTFWKPQTKFDRPPIWNVSTAGFMSNLPDDFLNVVKSYEHKVNTNSVFEINDTISSTYKVADKFWFMSRKNVYGAEEVGSVDTEDVLFGYYNLATNIDRIKYDSSGVARLYWLDTPTAGGAYNVRGMNSDGSLYSTAANYGGGGVSPACVIY